MTFGELLAKFKKQETADSIVPLVESVELRNGVVSWKSVVIKNKGPAECDEEADAAQWEWMWLQVSYDLNNFAVVAGALPQNIGSLFQRLKGLRLIYPDGTINSFAAKYLQSIILAKLPKPTKPPKPPKSSDSEDSKEGN